MPTSRSDLALEHRRLRAGQPRLARTPSRPPTRRTTASRSRPGARPSTTCSTREISAASAFPTWSNDGNTIVYASTPAGCTEPQGCTPGDQDGRLNVGRTDLYAVPYNNKAGGAATPVPGASTLVARGVLPGVLARRQAASPYTRGARRAGDVREPERGALRGAVRDRRAGAAIRLDANDPPACTRPVEPRHQQPLAEVVARSRLDVSGNARTTG